MARFAAVPAPTRYPTYPRRGQEPRSEYGLIGKGMQEAGKMTNEFLRERDKTRRLFEEMVHKRLKAQQARELALQREARAERGFQQRIRQEEEGQRRYETAEKRREREEKRKMADIAYRKDQRAALKDANQAIKELREGGKTITPDIIRDTYTQFGVEQKAAPSWRPRQPRQPAGSGRQPTQWQQMTTPELGRYLVNLNYQIKQMEENFAESWELAPYRSDYRKGEMEFAKRMREQMMQSGVGDFKGKKIAAPAPAPAGSTAIDSPPTATDAAGNKVMWNGQQWVPLK